MTKSELAALVADTANLTKKDAEAAVNAVFDKITAALAGGDKVQIAGFGSFEPRFRKARTGINPSTKEKITVKATTVPAFKAGKALKDAVAK